LWKQYSDTKEQILGPKQPLNMLNTGKAFGINVKEMHCNENDKKIPLGILLEFGKTS